MDLRGLLVSSLLRSAALARFCVVAVLLFGFAQAASAGEVIVQNDSVVNFTQVAIQAGFDPGEQAASWLTASCTGTIVGVQVFWLSATGATPNSLEQSINIFDEGVFPVPGVLLESLIAPLMVDGFLNEFRFLDMAQTVPLSVPVTNGQTFVVSFTFLSDPNPVLGPSIVNDLDGCQQGLNGIFVTSLSSWFSACTLGVSGDFVIRAVIDCGPQDIFNDGFESGDTLAWANSVGT